MCYSWCMVYDDSSVSTVSTQFQILWFCWFWINITTAGLNNLNITLTTPYNVRAMTHLLCFPINMTVIHYKCTVFCKQNRIVLISPILDILVLFTQTLPGDHHGQTAQAFSVVLFVVAVFTLTWSGVCGDQIVYPSGLEIILPHSNLVNCIRFKEI